jgi:hypothetical protein
MTHPAFHPVVGLGIGLMVIVIIVLAVTIVKDLWNLWFRK